MTIATELDALELMTEGTLALAQVEANGIRIDVEYLERTQIQVKERISDLRTQLQNHEIYGLQRKRFGPKTNLTSRQQLAKVLTDELGHTLPTTEKSTAEIVRYQLDETALEALDLDYGRLFLEFEKLNKLSGTYLNGIAKEVVDDILRPVFNLHLVKTFRGSSDSPNFQNIPIRNPEIAKLIRSAFIPRDNHVLVEVDYAALEFRVAACAYSDPAMISYASDSNRDIHRDCAAEIFKTTTDEVTKDSRYLAKNRFVFPVLYGDYYVQCARNCWEGTELLDVKVGELDMREHLKQQGITKLGLCDSNETPMPNTFELHMKNVEKTFFRWFPILQEKRDSFWKEYQKTGSIDLMTGFVIRGVWKRNFILNCIIQGPAFHLLLWSLIQMVKWTNKNKTRTKIVGQIHDSIIADVHVDELDDYLVEVKETMTMKAKEHFPWVVTPLDVEAEVAESNWFDKKAVEI